MKCQKCKWSCYLATYEVPVPLFQWNLKLLIKIFCTKNRVNDFFKILFSTWNECVRLERVPMPSSDWCSMASHLNLIVSISFLRANRFWLEIKYLFMGQNAALSINNFNKFFCCCMGQNASISMNNFNFFCYSNCDNDEQIILFMTIWIEQNR